MALRGLALKLVLRLLAGADEKPLQSRADRITQPTPLPRLDHGRLARGDTR